VLMGRHSSFLGGLLLAVLMAAMMLYIDFVRDLLRGVLRSADWWLRIQKVVMAHPLLFAGLLFMLIAVMMCAVWEASKQSW